MLVLGRKVGDSIVVDGGIEFVILKVKGNRVSVGVAAPKSVQIQRKELLERADHGGTERGEAARGAGVAVDGCGGSCGASNGAQVGESVNGCGGTLAVNGVGVGG